jgi:alpha-ketoglutarate-dependent taurine dioxygenase
MTLSAERLFEVTPVAPRIGSAVHTDKETLLSGAKVAAIRELLESRGVLVFPEIGMTDEEQIAFTHTLGTFAHEAGEGSADTDKVYPITMDERINPIASYLKGAFYWHLDGTMSDRPILASIMSAKRLSETGGETEFCNTYAAWDDLDEEEKRTLEPLQVHHAVWRTQLYHTPEPTIEQFRAWQGRGQNTLPLVWRHRSGRQSLVLGNTAMQVVGMDYPESEALLIRLRDWATQPQFVYRHHWKIGDMVLWDNTGTMHRALPYAHDSGRLMHRTKLEGEESFA